MTMNRIQFQPDCRWPSSSSATEPRRSARRRCRRRAGPGLRLPGLRRCGAHELRARRAAYWQCGACAHQCSLISGTIFEASKLPLTRWFLAMQLLTQSKNNVSALELRRQLGVSYRSAWLIKHKIMEAMRLREDRRELDGRVEIDDAYLGGERSGGKTGRGSENKVPFVAAVQTTAEGKPVLACLRQQPHTGEEVAVFAATHIAPSATVVSDGLWCFAPHIVGAEHERIVTGGGKASVKLPQFKAVNTLLGNLKTAITGTYHAFDFAKYAHRYLAEFQYRFNRRFNMKTILPRLLTALVAAPPSSERALRLAEIPR